MLSYKSYQNSSGTDEDNEDDFQRTEQKYKATTGEKKVDENVKLLRIKLVKQLENWLQSSLNRKSIADISNNFYQSIDSIKITGFQEPSCDSSFEDVDKVDVISEVRSILKPELGLIYKRTEGRLEKFAKTIDTHLLKNSSDLSDDLFYTAAKDSVRGISSPEVIKFIKLGCSTLEKEYRSRKTLNSATMEILKDCMETIPAFYKKHMEREMLSQQPHSPNLLLQKHKFFVKHLLILFKDSLPMKADSFELERQLSENFEEINAANMKKLLNYQQNIKRLIEKESSTYKLRMEQILEDNPKGLNSDDLIVRHKEEMENACSNLNYNIQKNVSQEEPIDIHAETLKKYIQKSLTAIEKRNQKYLNNDGKDSALQARKLLVEAEKKLSRTKDTSPIIIERPKTSKNDIVGGGPLLVLLTFKNIRVFYGQPNKGVQVIDVPAKICLNEEEKWICGDDVRKSTGKGSQVGNVWNLEECWKGSGSHSPPQYSVYLNGKDFKIKVDFILGLLFANAKSKVPSDCMSDLSKVLISVPFSLTSFERQQVFNGALMANYDEVNLINENSAWAYLAYESGLHQPAYDTVVISENCSKIDITLFSYDKQLGILSMHGHAGNYEYIRNNDKNYLKGTSRLLIPCMSEEKPDEDNELFRKLLGLWKLCCWRAEGQHPCMEENPIKVLIALQSKTKETVFRELAVEISKQQPTLVVNYNKSIKQLELLYEIFCSSDNGFEKRKFREGIPLDILACDQKSSKLSRLRKIDTYSIQGFITRKFHVKYAKIIKICEELGESKKLIGTIFLPVAPAKEYTDVVITIKRCSSGVITCEGIAYVNNQTEHYYSKDCKKILVSPNDYTWTPKGLSSRAITFLKSLISETVDTAEVENACRKAAEVKRQIEEGNIVFKGTLAKTIVLQRLEDAINTLKMTSSSTEAKTEAVEGIQNYFTTYNVC